MTPPAAIAQPPRMRHVARQELLRHIGGLAVGDRLPSLDELSNDLGIGRNNLQAAMRELAGEGVVVSRPRLGTYVARHPKSAGRQFTSSGNGASIGLAHTVHSGARVLAGKRIALVTNALTDSLHASMIRAAREAFDGTGVQLVEHVPRPLSDGAIELPESCDLAMVFNPSLPSHQPLICRVPVVVVSTAWHESYVTPMPCDMVGVDQYGGAFLAGELFRNCGFDSACFIGVRRRDESGTYAPVSALRLRGFEAGLGRSVAPETQLAGVGYSLSGGGSGFRRYMELKHPPKAIFAACDEMAVGFVIAAGAQGLHAGRDYHLIGFDGNRLGRELPEGSLTTVDVPVQAMGQIAAEVVTRRLLRPGQARQITCVTCQLHRGNTVTQPDCAAESKPSLHPGD